MINESGNVGCYICRNLKVNQSAYIARRNSMQTRDQTH